MVVLDVAFRRATNTSDPIIRFSVYGLNKYPVRRLLIVTTRIGSVERIFERVATGGLHTSRTLQYG